MPVKPIKEGDESKQGNARCPQCGAAVLITGFYNDPPKCPKCSVPYIPKLHPTPKFM